MMGHYILPEPSLFYLATPSDGNETLVKGYFEALMAIPDTGATLRVLQALAVSDVEWNEDDFSGFHYERSKILEVVKKYANNAIILGGDLHDSFAWVLFEGGGSSGEPVAVNLGGPGVTSPGFGPLFAPIFSPIEDAIGGPDGFYRLASDAYLMTNPGLQYADVEYKGFVAAAANKV
jgi:PhoD-like phosphatase